MVNYHPIILITQIFEGELCNYLSVSYSISLNSFFDYFGLFIPNYTPNLFFHKANSS